MIDAWLKVYNEPKLFLEKLLHIYQAHNYYQSKHWRQRYIKIELQN